MLFPALQRQHSLVFWLPWFVRNLLSSLRLLLWRYCVFFLEPFLRILLLSLLFNSFITMCLHMIYCVIILLQVCRAPQKCLSIFSINFVQFSAVVSSDISSTLVFLFQCHIFKTFLLCPVCFSSSFLDFQSFLSLYFR